jgi:hypothetical protein
LRGGYGIKKRVIKSMGVLLIESESGSAVAKLHRPDEIFGHATAVRLTAT